MKTLIAVITVMLAVEGWVAAAQIVPVVRGAHAAEEWRCEGDCGEGSGCPHCDRAAEQGSSDDDDDGWDSFSVPEVPAMGSSQTPRVRAGARRSRARSNAGKGDRVSTTKRNLPSPLGGQRSEGGRVERGKQQPRAAAKAKHRGERSEHRGEVAAAPVASAALDQTEQVDTPKRKRKATSKANSNKQRKATRKGGGGKAKHRSKRSEERGEVAAAPLRE